MDLFIMCAWCECVLMHMFCIRSTTWVTSVSRFMVYVYQEHQMKFLYLDGKYHAIVFPFKRVFCPLWQKFKLLTFVSHHIMWAILCPHRIFSACVKLTLGFSNTSFGPWHIYSLEMSKHWRMWMSHVDLRDIDPSDIKKCERIHSL